ncbi:ion transport protein [Chloropicon primus]|uniref:Ion transport protein n=1 Tax=Chloropicon primus TaxID=1764295 RepID=A0A5B8ML60_9CHLO|nr:ion transport protein [Chloropicon primus]UPR00407.1 ion transport protein [Chloropicon primus]|eukprot:QDZ21193.1 ion transport protein [Chloropicon primus]
MSNKVAPGIDDSPPPMLDNLVDNTPSLGEGTGYSIEDELQNNSNMFRDEAKIEAEEQDADRRESRTSLIARILGKEEPKIRMVGPLRTKSVIKRYTTEVWDPRSTGRLRWDAVVVVCVLYNCLVLPFRIGFGDDEFGPLSVLELMVDVMFITDIFVNFRTGYFTFDREEDEYILVLKQPQAAYHYARTWFFFDLVSSLPVDLLLLFNMNSKTLLYLRFPRMLRLLRLPRLFRYLNRWEQQIGISRQAFRMAKTLFLLFEFAHFSACMQFFSAKFMDFPDTSWVVKANIDDDTKPEQYAYSLFTSLSHMLCIGYGPTGGPENVTEVCLIMASMCIGASFYIILVGMISSNLVEKDTGLAKRKDHPALLELQKKQRASLLIREKSMFASPRINR